jgi:hypothetical protein
MLGRDFDAVRDCDIPELRRRKNVANNPTAFSWRTLLQRRCSLRLARSFATLTILALSLPGTSWADAVATVVFTNGDRLTGTLKDLSGTQLQFRPALHTLGDVLNMGWEKDAIGELDLGPGCVNQEGANVKTAEVCFQSAIIRPASDNTVTMTTEDGQMFSSITSLTIAAAKTNPAANGAVVPKKETASKKKNASSNPSHDLISMWSLGLNAPESAINATQSSQNLGGLLVSNLYFDDPNHLIFSAAGTHQHNYSTGKSIKTDLFDSFVQFGHTFGSKPSAKFTFYQVGEWFFNTSLGLAAQRSAGAGVFSPTLRPLSENFSLKFGADLRYFNERIYGTSSVLDLAGSRIQAKAIYKSADRKYFISAVTWINPMWNNESAWQAYGNLTLSLPFGKHVCLDFTPASDEYLENAPHGDRKNYLSSTATLKIIAGPNPSQTCSE